MGRINREKAQRDMMRAYVKDINANLVKSVPKIKSVITPVIFRAIYNSPEMDSIRGGTLKLDFGIERENTFEIASAVSRSIDVKFKRFTYRKSGIIGGVTIYIQPTDYFELLSLSGSVTITEKGVTLPWLDWLLNYGDSIIIVNFGVKYTDGGRTGGAIMSQGSRPFRVNPRYAGSPDSNFITRALNKSYKEIEDAIWRVILN